MHMTLKEPGINMLKSRNYFFFNYKIRFPDKSTSEKRSWVFSNIIFLCHLPSTAIWAFHQCPHNIDTFLAALFPNK